MSSFDYASDNHIEILFDQGNRLALVGELNKALEIYDKILSVAPMHVGAINNRGNCLFRLGRYAQAIDCYDRVLEFNASDLLARRNRGIAFRETGRLNKAIEDYDYALSVNPNYAEALIARGWTHMDIGRPKEAIRDLRRALALRPNDTVLYTSLLFTLNFDSDATTESQQAERARWAAPLEKLARSFVHGNVPEPARKLRIGYVSSHFRHQAATYSFGGVIVHHDPGQFDIFCYSDTTAEDDLTALLRDKAAKWHDTKELSDDRLVDLIRSDGIDILVDLVGHMVGHRLLVFARKPAPLQVTAWGEPTGTGLRAIDYLFADPVAVPISERPLLAEKVLDLPNFIGFWTPDELPQPGPLPAIERGYVTFGSFNRFSKIMPAVLHCWAAILDAVPNSRLVLKSGGGAMFAPDDRKAEIMAVLSGNGIASDRVTILDELDRRAHYSAYSDLDIALDPFPHGGGMTTLEALWMGVPVVTAPGRTISSRLAAATLVAAQLPEFVAADRESYIQLAVASANDIAKLASLRATLRSRVASTAFGNPILYARAVERQYRAIWEDWCRNRA